MTRSRLAISSTEHTASSVPGATSDPICRTRRPVYAAFGSINAILATLEHIVDLACRSAARATRHRRRPLRRTRLASRSSHGHSRTAIAALEHAYREVAAAHGDHLTSRLRSSLTDGSE